MAVHSRLPAGENSWLTGSQSAPGGLGERMVDHSARMHRNERLGLQHFVQSKRVSGAKENYGCVNPLALFLEDQR